MNKKYYKLIITETGKPVGSKQERFENWGVQKTTFNTLAEVKQTIKEKYSGHKKSFIFVDGEDGQPIKVGKIYHYKSNSFSDDNKFWFLQDWVEVREVVVTPLKQVETTILV
jgi:hypothetical protein